MKTFLLDASHGGMINGKYQTAEIIGKKSYFLKGKLLLYQGYSVPQMEKMCDLKYYEGVGNRDIVRRIKLLCDKERIRYFDVVDSEKDIPLYTRTYRGNKFYAKDRDCVYLAINSNAFNKQQAHGYTVWTSKGQTKSDGYATIFWNEFRAMFPNDVNKGELSDGDVDYEAQFYVLAYTAMPAVLTESLFYTNYQDVLILSSEAGRQKIAQAHFNAMKIINKL